MDADEHALLLAVHAAPADDLPRLVYADWLDDAGCPGRAGFIRLHLDWHRALTDPAHAAYRNHLFNRLQDHVLAHGDPGPDDGGGTVGWGDYKRGLPTRATVRADALPGPLAEVFVLAPLETIEVRDARPEHLLTLLDLPQAVGHTVGELALVRPVFLGGQYNLLRERFGGLVVRAG